MTSGGMFLVPVWGELPRVTSSAVWQFGVSMCASAPVRSMAAELIRNVTGGRVADCDCAGCGGCSAVGSLPDRR